MKTVFITLVNRAIYRNLFFFKKSVFYRLKEEQKKNPNLRIVLVAPKHQEKIYKEVLKNELNDRCLIVPADVSSPSGIKEKLFYFFYSYLIYTGTTKLLATMGMRPDEPPAGGKRYLSLFKWLIANTFGKSAWVKTTLVPHLFPIVYKTTAYSDIFEKYKPDLVFISHIYGWSDAHVLAEAKKRNIKTIGMAAGWDHLDKYFLPLHVDTLLAQSNETKNSALKYQMYEPDKVSVVGYPHFDFIADPEIVMPREEILKFLNLPLNACYIIYVSGSAYCPDEPAIIEKVISWMKEKKFGPDMYLIVRPYSGGRSKDKEFDQKKFDRFAEDPSVRFFSADLWDDVYMSKIFTNTIRYCDVLIGMYTTLVLEAAVLDRPIAAAAFDGHRTLPMYRSIRRFEKFEHFQDVLKTGALATGYNFDELFSILDRYIKNPEWLKEERKLMRKELCHVLDCKGSERIVNTILAELR